MRIYREIVKIEGLGEFEKVCNFSLKGKIFSIVYPVRKIKDNLIDTDKVYANNLKEAEIKWLSGVREFEALGKEYESVIIYDIDEYKNNWDGSGVGFWFNWGVFRKIKNDDYKRNYFFERGYKNSKEISAPYQDYWKWKEIKWSEQAEQFFNNLSESIEQLHSKLNDFVNNTSIEKVLLQIENGKL